MQPTDEKEPPRDKPHAGLLRSWFELTQDERTALILILALFLLGLLARWWHLYQKE